MAASFGNIFRLRGGNPVVSELVRNRKVLGSKLTLDLSPCDSSGERHVGLRHIPRFGVSDRVQWLGSEHIPSHPKKEMAAKVNNNGAGEKSMNREDVVRATAVTTTDAQVIDTAQAALVRYCQKNGIQLIFKEVTSGYDWHQEHQNRRLFLIGAQVPNSVEYVTIPLVFKK